jgi:FixJ family two-component response regulator
VSNANSLIAVVDDEAAVRTMLKRALRVAGDEVATFAGGEEFLASLTARRPACVVLDIHMSDVSGLVVAQRMRAAAPDLPVILITASDDVALEGTAAAAGAVCLLRKPFSSEALLAAVRDAEGGHYPST